jgi:choline-sulfatase
MPIKKPQAKSNAGGGTTPRRRVVPAALLFTVGLALLALWWWTRTPRFTLTVNPDRNVLLVTIDTLRADALGSYGGRAQTPNLDRLAARGARFDFAHAHAVVTLPSHASIFTGRYPYEHGVRDNTGYRLDAKQPTIATLLKARGFATGGFIGGFPLDRRFGLNAGFDAYDDRLSAAPSAEASDRERRADLVAKPALDWIAQQPGKWFAWVHVYDPHVTYAPPVEWASRFPADPYLGEVSWTDFALGPLFDRLSSQPRPTLVVVTADHGEGLGDHGETTHGLFAYESTLRVPLLMGELGQGRAEPEGVVISTPVRHVDVLPTVLEAVGGPAPGGAGTSLRPTIDAGRGDDRPSYFEAMTATVTRGWAPLRGVMLGAEKYIDLPIPELYDLGADRSEANNLAGSKPDRAQVLLNALKLFNMAPPARGKAESAETLDRLRSLGYVGGNAAPARERYTEDDDPKRLIRLEQTMEQAARAYRDGRPADAIPLYRLVIATRKDTEDAYRKLALVYWRSGRPREAIATLEEALTNGVTQSEVRMKLAQYLAEAGEPARAIALLEHDAGDDPDAIIALGNAYSMAGRGADALRTFRRLAALDPNNGLAHQNIGIAELRAGNNKGAEESLRRALALDASLAGAHTALGVILATSGRRDAAIDAWKRAIEIDATEFNALFNLTLNLAQAGRINEAHAYGQRFIDTAPAALQKDAAAIRAVLEKR